VDDWRVGFAGKVESLRAALDPQSETWTAILGNHGFENIGQVPTKEKALKLFSEYQDVLDKPETPAQPEPPGEPPDQPEMPV